jgi:hypothetical protein
MILKRKALTMSVTEVAFDSHSTLRELLGGPESRERFKTDPIFLEFQKKTRRVLAIADQHMLDYGEVLLVINRVYGMIWDTIPFYKYTEVEQLINQNWYRFFEILNPQAHALLITSDNDYSIWYHYHLRAHTPKEAVSGSD